MQMVVGLGNPGPRYETTRHNAGFMVLDLLADELGINFNSSRHQALIGRGMVGERRVLLVKPQTFMNNSGQAVAPLARWYSIAPAEMIIVHDDLDLAPGRMRIRPAGSSGGHRGLQSIITALGTTAIPRLKIGIGRPQAGEDVVDYVLRPFSEGDWALVGPALLKAARALRFLLEGGGLEEAMNRFNSRGNDSSQGEPAGVKP
ncbi:aminoacyl-tRNA hydrolase [Neomoorella glycerini]|uniref:aminoacyl-tRNA hydrolase n=1 Tax=Neomoorella glycerini TaxID=55779 RepID=UPI001FE319A7|nr:aminoacyl-tRNA hydrolase [Moorella glycerini]